MASSGKAHHDDLEITAIGALYTGPLEKKYWSSSRGKEKYPYPVGYQATRWHGGHSYFMEVTEGPRGPLFAVTCEEGIACSGQTPFAPWEEILKKRHAGMKRIVPRSSSASLDGPEMFGFTHPLVQRLCRDLVVSANGLAETIAGEGITRGKVKNLKDPTLGSVKDSNLAESSDNSRRRSKRGSGSYNLNDEKHVDHNPDRQEMKLKLGQTGKMKTAIQNSGNKSSEPLSRGREGKMKGLEGIFSNLTAKSKPEVPVDPRASPPEYERMARPPGVPAKRRRSSRPLASEVDVAMPLMTDVKISSSDLLSASGSVTRRKRHLIAKGHVSNQINRTSLHPFGKQHTAVVTVDVVEDSVSPGLEKHGVPDSLFEENEEARMNSENGSSPAKPAKAPVSNVLDEASPSHFNGKKRLRLAKSDRGLPIRPTKIEKSSPVRVLLSEKPRTLPLITADEETHPPAVISEGTPTTSIVAPETSLVPASVNFRKSLDSHEYDKYETKVDLTQSQGVLSVDLMCPSIEDMSGPKVESAKLSPGTSESVSQQDGVFLLLEAVSLAKMTKRDAVESDEKLKEISSGKNAIAEAKISINGQDDCRSDGDGIEGNPKQTVFAKCGGEESRSPDVCEEGSIKRIVSERNKEEDFELPNNVSSDKNSIVEVELSRDDFSHAHKSPQMDKIMQESPPTRAAESLPTCGGNATQDFDADRIPASNPSAVAAGEGENGLGTSATKLTSNYVDTVNVRSAEALIDVKQKLPSSVAIKSTSELSENYGNAMTSPQSQAVLLTSSVVEDMPNLLAARENSELRAQETSGTEEQVNTCVVSISGGSRNSGSGALEFSMSTKPSVVEGTHGRNSGTVDSIAPIPFENTATYILPAPSIHNGEENADPKVTGMSPPCLPGATFGLVLENGVVTTLSSGRRVDLLTHTLPDEHNEVASIKEIHKETPGENCFASLAASAKFEMERGIAGHVIENGVISVLPPDHPINMEDTVPDMVSVDYSQPAHFETTKAPIVGGPTLSSGTSVGPLVEHDLVRDNGNSVTTTVHVISDIRPGAGPLPDKRSEALSDADGPVLMPIMKALDISTQLSSNVNSCQGSCPMPNEATVNLIPVDRTGEETPGDNSKGDDPCLCSSTPETMKSSSSLVEADAALEKQCKTTVGASKVDLSPVICISGEELNENSRRGQGVKLTSNYDTEDLSNGRKVDLGNSGSPGNHLLTTNTSHVRQERSRGDWICQAVPLEDQEHSSKLASVTAANESKSINESLNQSEVFLGCHSQYPTVGKFYVPEEPVKGRSLYSRRETSGSLRDRRGGQDSTGNLGRDAVRSEEKVLNTNDNPVGITSLPEQERSTSADYSPKSGDFRESASSIHVAGEPVGGDKKDHVSSDKRTCAEAQQKGSKFHVGMDDLTTLGHVDYADIMNDGLENLNSFENDLDMEEHEHDIDAADGNSKIAERNLDVICNLPSDFPLPVSSQLHSESSEPESLSAQVTKSMLTILLPQSVPLLSNGSKQKHCTSIGDLHTCKAIPTSPVEGKMGAENELHVDASQAEGLHSVGSPPGRIADCPPFVDSAHADDEMLFNVTENAIAERYFPAQDMTLMQVTSDVSFTQLANNSITEGAGKAIRPVQFDAAPIHSTVMSARDGVNGQVLIECQSLQVDPEEGTTEISDSGENALRKEDINVLMEVAVETLSRGREDCLRSEGPSKAKLDLPFIRDDSDFDMLVNSEAEGQKNLTVEKGFVHGLSSFEKPSVSVEEGYGEGLNVQGGPDKSSNLSIVPFGVDEGGGSIGSENTLDYEGLVSTVKQLHENSKKMDPLLCIEHKLPVMAVVVSLQGDKVRLCVVSGVVGGKERSFFVYEVTSKTNEAVKSQILCSSESTCENAGPGTHQLEIPMEESAIRFSPDGQQLLLLDCFQLSSSCHSNTNDKDGHGVNIVSFEREEFRVNKRLQCDSSMQCLAVPGPRLVIAAGVDGCICCWEMDSDWRNCTEHFSLPRATRGDTSFSSVTRLSVMPGSPHVVLGCDYDGYFTLWDAKSRTILSSCHLPGHYVLKASWLETVPFSVAQVERSERYPAKSQVDENTWREHFLGIFPCLLSMVCSHKESDSMDNASGLTIHDDFVGKNGMEWSCKPLMLRKDDILCGPGLSERALAITALGRYGVVGTLEGLVQVWDITCGRMFCELNELEGSSIVKLATNPSSRVLVAANVRGQVVLYVERDNLTLSSRT